MSDKHPTRRDLMKPVQLLGFAFAAALFGGLVTLVTMGFFQDLPAPKPGELEPHLKILTVSGVVAGISFIATLVIIALLMLAVDPAQATKQIDRPVLLPDGDDPAPAGEGEADGTDGTAPGGPSTA